MLRVRLCGTMLGTVAALAVAGSVLGATWGTPVAISGAYTADAMDLVTLDANTVVAAYTQTAEGINDIDIRRSINAGATWSSPLLATSNGEFPDLASNGSQVDLVYNSPNGRVWYRTSNDGGVTFATAIALSPVGRYNWLPAVGRGPGGVVAVGFVDAGNQKASVRVSTDGGATFGGASILSTTATDEAMAVAVGNGVIYVAYSNGFSDLRIRRSTNNGVSWSTATKLSGKLFDDDYRLAADGTHAYIAYTVEGKGSAFSTLLYRRTINSGATWGSPGNMAPTSWSTEGPALALSGGVLRAAFTRCIPDIDVCDPTLVYYEQSSTGTSWGSAQRVSPNTLAEAWDPAVGAHRAIVGYLGEDSSSDKAYVRNKS